MSERLEPRAYLDELKALRETITAATSRAQALDEEEKPLAVAEGLDLEALAWLLERAEERALQAVRAAEILGATRGVRLE